MGSKGQIMKIAITDHARKRVKDYGISEDLLKAAIQDPDNVAEGYGGRKIYQKKLNGYLLRIIVEEDKEIKRVITTYKARSERYEV